MALKVELKPHERIIIGNCVITNTDQRARFLIDCARERFPMSWARIISSDPTVR